MVRAYKGYDTKTAQALLDKKAEVAFDDEDPREVWFPATVLKHSGGYLVEYQKPGNGDQVLLHKTTVDFWHIRPPPPHLSCTDFDLREMVDAYYDYGWWRGVITSELADNKYSVFFEHSKKEREFICSEVRPHLEWKRGGWYHGGCHIRSFERTAFCMCIAGKKVEVTFDKKMPYYSAKVWFPATVVKHSNNDTIQVEYQQPGSGHEAILHKASVDSWHIRPSLPHLRDKDFGLDDEVEAYYDYGWWHGTITEELPDNRYSVLIDHSREEREFICSNLRPYLEWNIFKHGEMFNFHHEQTELTNPNTGTQSTAATSIMKPAKQTIVDSYDGNSPPSKKMKNDTVLEDSSKKTSTSTSQSEGLDSEIAKTENLSHGKKSSTEIVPSVAEGDTEQLDALWEQLTVVDKEVHKDNASAVASKRKRRRPLGLQAKSPETLLIASHENEGVDPFAASVVESSQMKEVGSPTSSGTKSLEKDKEPLKQDKLLNESHKQDLKANRSGKKYSSVRRKRVKRQTVSINTEAPVKDSQDASKEKVDENMETRKTDASAGKELDIVSDDQHLSRWIDGMDSPILIYSPASEERLEAVTCDTNVENLPFVKRSPLWHTIEAMEAFQKIPQNPHFRPLLEGVKESAREGLVIGTMVTFSSVLDRTSRLRFDDPRTSIEDSLETLVDLESNGFDVEVLRHRLTCLLLLKDKKVELEDRSKGVVDKLEQKLQEKTIDGEVDEIDRQIRQLEETRRKALLKKEEWNLEVHVMKATEEAMEQKIMELAAEFDGLAVAPFAS